MDLALDARAAHGGTHIGAGTSSEPDTIPSRCVHLTAPVRWTEASSPCPARRSRNFAPLTTYAGAPSAAGAAALKVAAHRCRRHQAYFLTRRKSLLPIRGQHGNELGARYGWPLWLLVAAVSSCSSTPNATSSQPMLQSGS